MQKAGTADDPAKVAKVLREDKWETPRGIVTFDKNGRAASGALINLVVKDGKLIRHRNSTMEIVFQQVANGLSVGMGYALVALGLSLIFGVLHVINFAHGRDLHDRRPGHLDRDLAAGRALSPRPADRPSAVGDPGPRHQSSRRSKPLLQRRDGGADVLLAAFAVACSHSSGRGRAVGTGVSPYIDRAAWRNRDRPRGADQSATTVRARHRPRLPAGAGDGA